MTKALILYYSAYGHMERMAEAVAEGVREAGAEADIKRVPELVSEDVAKKSGYKLDQKAHRHHRPCHYSPLRRVFPFGTLPWTFPLI
jgi:multimeric flavodoxin WrbA